MNEDHEGNGFILRAEMHFLLISRWLGARCGDPRSAKNGRGFLGRIWHRPKVTKDTKVFEPKHVVKNWRFGQVVASDGLAAMILMYYKAIIIAILGVTYAVMDVLAIR